MDLAIFADRADAWLAEHAVHAPRDYGAILPIELYDRGVAWQQRLFAHGWAGLHWPIEYGGQGLSPEHNAAWIERCALANVPPFINMVGIVLAGGAITRFGTDEQKATLLRSTLAAEIVWCQLFSEPGAGSDLASLTTTATRDGDRFIVNGQKVWCSGGRYSHWGILMARTDSAVAKHKGISFFVIDMHTPGIECRPLRQMTGEAEFDEVFFTDVELPLGALLGEINSGWNIGMTVLTSERGHIGASVIGLERRLGQMAAMAEGHELSTVDRLALVELLGRGRAYSAMGRRQGAQASIGGSLMKLGITEMMFDAAILRATITGADAMLDGPASAQVLTAPGGRIAGGSSQVQRNLIGERLLGLPKEPS